MEKEFNLCLKTGYLLKWVKQSWRIFWFTLHESELICHTKRDKSVVSEIITLQGVSVVCPCFHDEDVNIECAFKLNIPNGEELLFQASGSQDRDRWAHAIGAVIRSISSAYQVSNSPAKFQHFRAKANVSEVLGALQDPDAGVEMGSHVRDGIVHKNSFKGSDIIDWLLRWNIVRRRGDGVAMAQALLKLGHLQEVDMADGTAGLLQMFKDGEKLYRFTSLNLGVERNRYFDSSDSDSSLSDDEDDQKASDKVKKGKVARTGFVLKKRSFRKGLRLVRIILRDNPPSLEYESPFQLSKKDLPAECQQTKFVDLNNCYLVDSSKSSTELPVSVTKEAKASPKLRVYVRSRGKKCRTFQAKDEEEWFEYFSLLHSLCGMKKPDIKEKEEVDKDEVPT